MTDRERFERIVSMSPFELNCAKYPNNESYAWPGNYRAYQVQLCWDVCQAYAKPLHAEIENLKLKLEASYAVLLAIRKELQQYTDGWNYFCDHTEEDGAVLRVEQKIINGCIYFKAEQTK